MAKYETVNGQWPKTIPPLTEQEAFVAARRLWRFGTKNRWAHKIGPGKHRQRGRAVRVLQEEHPRDKRRMIIVMRVDVRAGWHGLVHDLSHRVHARLHGHSKNYDSHDARHAFIEREMINHVVGSGWLDGKLRRAPKIQPPVDKTKLARERTVASIKRWTSKKKRAETALRKLTRRLRRLERAA